MIYIVRTYSHGRGQTGIFVVEAQNTEDSVQKVRLHIQRGGCENVSLSDKCVPEKLFSPQTIHDSEVTIII